VRFIKSLSITCHVFHPIPNPSPSQGKGAKKIVPPLLTRRGGYGVRFIKSLSITCHVFHPIPNPSPSQGKGARG